MRAFGKLRRTLPTEVSSRLHLVIAGGYDTRVSENVQHYDELQVVAAEEGLAHGGYSEDASAVLPSFPPRPADASPLGYAQVQSSGLTGGVTFIRSFTDAQKGALLRAASVVVYTPAGEHFGIVPLECMASFRPVLAVNSGGPTESVLHGATGWLCPPTAEVSHVVGSC